MESDACVIVINGRTPDEGSVFWAAVAFGSGKPVIIHKNDYHQFMATGDNSMVTGLTLDFIVNKDLFSLNNLVEAKINKYNKAGILKKDKISGYNKKLLEIGKELTTYLNNLKTYDHSKEGFKKIIEQFSDSESVNILIPKKDLSIKEPLNITDPNVYSSQYRQSSVYCSGPLFSPAEINEMDNIGAVLNDKKLLTYVPHRDGTETMIDALDIPKFCTIPILKDILNLFVPVDSSGLEQAMANHSADHNSFELDVFFLNVCAYFVINLNGRTPDDGAVVEAGINFAMGKPCVIFRSDPRRIFAGESGSIHPALQMAGHLFNTVSHYDLIYDNLVKQTFFIKNLDNQNQYSNSIHPLVLEVFNKGDKLDSELEQLYIGNASPWYWYRYYKTHTYSGIKYWKPKHVYSQWPKENSIEEEANIYHPFSGKNGRAFFIKNGQLNFSYYFHHNWIVDTENFKTNGRIHSSSTFSEVYSEKREHSEVYFKGEDGYLKFFFVEQAIWKFDGEGLKFGDKVAGAISAVYSKKREHTEVFFKGNDEYLRYFYVENNQWMLDKETFSKPACKVQGDISAVYSEKREHSEVFFKNAEGYLAYFYMKDGNWNIDVESFKTGGKVDGCISAVYSKEREHSEVFYRGEDGYLRYFYVKNNEWMLDKETFSKPTCKVQGDISAVYSDHRKHSEVYFRGEDGNLKFFFVENFLWMFDGESFKIGGNIGGKISSVYNKYRYHSEVFYLGTDGHLKYFYPEFGRWRYLGTNLIKGF